MSVKRSNLGEASNGTILSKQLKKNATAKKVNVPAQVQKIISRAQQPTYLLEVDVAGSSPASPNGD